MKKCLRTSGFKLNVMEIRWNVRTRCDEPKSGFRSKRYSGFCILRRHRNTNVI